MGNVAGGLLTIAFFVCLAYFIKLDMADMTGMGRKAAAEKMKPLAEQLGYSLIASRTPQQQGGIEKNFGGFSITVNGDRSRIEVEFKRSLGLRLSSLKKNDFNQGDLETLAFSNDRLNQFFHLKAASAKMKTHQDQLEQTLILLADSFGNRKVDYLYVKDEYLRIGFAHRNYLPTSVIADTVPVLESVAKALMSIGKESRKSA